MTHEVTVLGHLHAHTRQWEYRDEENTNHFVVTNDPSESNSRFP